MSFFLARRLGDLLYYFDLKHKSLVYSHIKKALGESLSPSEISAITRKFYQGLGQDLIEIFLIPLVNKEYMKKYVEFTGLEHIEAAFKKGNGLILLGAHEGSWELSNILSANLGFPYSMIVRGQRYPRLNKLLNIYRRLKGCKLIEREDETRELIATLKRNESIGVSLDQGGKTGTLVKFFGQNASMATGALRLALKHGSAIIPVFFARVRGPYIKVIIEGPFELKKTGARETDIKDNLQGLVHIYEKYIRMYPHEYLWTYKVWKHADEKNILILSDKKAGHLRQAEALVKIIRELLKTKNITAHIDNIEVEFKNKFAERALTLSSCLSGKYHCQGCLWCLRAFLKEESYQGLIRKKPDIIISSGSSLAAINYVLARESLAKSLVVMRPSILSTRRFDLVVMPKHDLPPKRKNVVATEGALNLIDEDYLKEEADKLIKASGSKLSSSGFYLSLLIGGDTKKFRLKPEMVLKVIKEVKSAAENLHADILITTSRRTSKEIEGLIKEEFKNYPRCKVLIIANEKNIPEAVGGILGLSRIIIASAESISMISEAVNSKKYVFVFKSEGLSRKHQRLLDYLVKNKNIYLDECSSLSKKIQDIWQARPAVNPLKDNQAIFEALKKIL